ncbi:putative F-box domain, leucine-rich repeat domain, L domain-containing protein [Rosa chinensis]|uniref:Putative F-box domain, leucine-rich repeat domain, L domain-containing protein n=1 Tax=Rosa chinensis TaxID=74649 RepID=A0A2P6S2L8_ROSCH|nr:F-box/LRR-repeat protein At3g26922 [Rosa chinensis]PRQ52915.1 putative F-box domain, leucine-rich repeat domain, L domain-containing protein [Rosa chinensis]
MAAETSTQVLLLHAKRLRGPNRSLNDLPDEILLHILSFLPTLDAVNTSLISRRWRPLWSLVPSLNFSYHLFPPAPESDLNPTQDQAQFFAHFIDRALILRPDSPIQTFRLSFIFHQGYHVHVDSWIRCAVTRLKARQLHLDFFIDDNYHDGDTWLYDFHLSLLRHGCVEVLRLTRCFVTLPANMSAMNLCSLRSIFIERIDLTDQMVRDLISGCPNLEDLELRSCVGLKNLNICSNRIKKLALGYDYDSESKQSIEIDCPNLCSLSFSDCSSAQFVLKEAPALVEFRVDFACLTDKYFDLWSKIVRLLEKAPHVEKLDVQNWWYKLLISEDPFPKDFKLNNLNHLELRTGHTQYDLVGMAALLKLCPNLQTMVLDYLDTMKEDENLPEEFLNELVEFNMPKLKKVTIIAYTGTEVQLNFVTILKKQGVKIELVCQI